MKKVNKPVPHPKAVNPKIKARGLSDWPLYSINGVVTMVAGTVELSRAISIAGNINNTNNKNALRPRKKIVPSSPITIGHVRRFICF